MTADVGPTRDEAQRYYEDFSLAVGLRDWLAPNPRHEQLKLFIRDLLGDRRGLKIADVGCGAGVMTSNLRRYGDVTGLDFSGSAVRAAQRLVPGVRFLNGSLEALPPEDRFDLLTLFDVLEHIPQHDRPAFLRELRARLVDGGLLFFSTPFPAYTAYRRQNRDDTLQIVDEEVELQDVIVEARAVGLQLLEYRAFDVFRGSPEYQMMLFTTAMAPGGSATLRSPALRRRLRWIGTPVWTKARRVAHAAQLGAHGRFRDAQWVLTGQAPTARS
jgi:2-polyprenyl-3-methyl-5-hydroxy-6-metoxy-1,4-benzoquinol methylase